MNKSKDELVRIWRGIRDNCSKEFASFSLFWGWAISSGFSAGSRLVRTDEGQPYSRDNCEWVLEEDEGFTAAEAKAQWDRMVDKIRQRQGMEPILTSNPCIGCSRLEKCNAFGEACKTRKRYWDVRMKQIRRKLGAER